jgi:tRNA pseudouridine13 synthase
VTGEVCTQPPGLDAAWFGLHRASGQPVASGRVRVSPEDFQVEELLDVAPESDGEHLLLCVRKCNWNTADVARWLARNCGLGPRAITWSGLKDRRSLSTQWFGLHAPGVALQLPPPPEGLEWVRWHRQRRKLRIGSHHGNRFRLILRDVQATPQALHRRLFALARHGVPNYFGPQRFGRDGSNLALGEALAAGQRVRDRERRAMTLSAMRAFLFNRIVSERVAHGCWRSPLAGDLMGFTGSRSLFAATPDTAQDVRLARCDLHPTGPLPGRGGPRSSGLAAELEHAVLAAFPHWLSALDGAGVEAARRNLRMPVLDLHWRQCAAECWELGFRLPAGGFATSVLRELGAFADG